MTKLKRTVGVLLPRLCAVLAALLLMAGCGLFRTKSKITVPQLLTPLAVADTRHLIDEINRHASVRAINGRVDLQFLDTSYASCGLADLYRTADGRVVVQRPGQVYVLVQFLNVKIAEMSSNGERFWAAVYQGDERFRRFVTGTNTAEYEKLSPGGATADCNERDEKRREQAMQRATVTALSSMRPQHFTDALLVPGIPAENSNLLYAQAESFEEEPDTRPGARRGARIMRGYYVLSELEPQGENRASVLRRFWFDRVGQQARLARVQTYNRRGELVTDVTYSNPQNFGGDGQRRLPAQIELTRPQESYSIRITFQDPGSVKVDQPLPDEAFVLQNASNLQVVDLDARRN